MSAPRHIMEPDPDAAGIGPVAALWAIVLVLLIVLLVAFGASTAHAQAQGPSVAYKMATIDCQCVPSAAKVATYSRLLTKLVTRKCKERRLRLADEVGNAQHFLAHDGFGHYRYLKLMRLLDRVNP